MARARFENLVREQHDLSCASAALATLLNYHYETAIDAEAAFMAMYESGDRERIARDGFSMLDMKRMLAAHGFEANGYRAGLDRLSELAIPAIALIDLRGYSHFVVITGLDADYVRVADPAAGARTYRRTAFEDMWNGVLFLISNRLEIGRRHFNADFGIADSAD